MELATRQAVVVAADGPAKTAPANGKESDVASDGPTPVAASANVDLARLISRASLLLSQGNIGTARIVLERAAETGSAPALFALAETYDQITLTAWGTSARKAMSPRHGNSMPRRLLAELRRRETD